MALLAIKSLTYERKAWAFWLGFVKVRKGWWVPSDSGVIYHVFSLLRHGHEGFDIGTFGYTGAMKSVHCAEMLLKWVVYVRRLKH